MTTNTEMLAPLIEAAIEQVAAYDNIRWDLTYMQMPPYGQVQPCLVLTKPSPVLGEGLLACAPMNYTSVARVPDEDEILTVVRLLVEGLREQEASVMKAQNPPNGHRP